MNKEKVTEKVVINALIEDMDVVKAIEVKGLLARYNTRLMAFSLVGLAVAFGLVLICAGVNVLCDYLAIGDPTDWPNFWDKSPILILLGMFPFVFYSFGFSAIHNALKKKIEDHVKNVYSGVKNGSE